MRWIVRFVEEFDQEFRAIEEDTQDALLAAVKVLENYGPELGRPPRRYVERIKVLQQEGAPICRCERCLACSIRV